MAGRRPLNKNIKLVTGNPGKRPIREDEPDIVPGWPTPMRSLTKRAEREWMRLANLLDAEQRLSPADGPTLDGCVLAYDAAMSIRDKLRKKLPTDVWLRLKTGERLQWEMYRKFLNDLCITQGTRARASKSGGRGKTTSKLEDFHNKRKNRTT
jgi:phage terminase small subunit